MTMFDVMKKGKEKNIDCAVQRPERFTEHVNHTGIPTQLKERLGESTGVSFDDVRVHYSSALPARLNALVDTQGNKVEIAPGQERHLPHELGHVVQQKLGAVRANAKHSSGEAMNTDVPLEQQADESGNGAGLIQRKSVAVVQRKKKGKKKNRGKKNKRKRQMVAPQELPIESEIKEVGGSEAGDIEEGEDEEIKEGEAGDTMGTGRVQPETKKTNRKVRNKFLNPNSQCKTGIKGKSEYISETNDMGWIIHVRADDLRLKNDKKKGSEQKQGRKQHKKNSFGKQPGDHAGHLIGDQFGGSKNLDNIVSMAKDVDSGIYYKLEKKWADALKTGNKVKVDININYDKNSGVTDVKSCRPISFEVNYCIKDKQDNIREEETIKIVNVNSPESVTKDSVIGVILQYYPDAEKCFPGEMNAGESLDKTLEEACQSHQCEVGNLVRDINKHIESHPWRKKG